MLELWRQAGFEPVGVMWAITEACNMKCRHCGADAGKPLQDELSLKEGLALCDDLASTGCKNVSLTGGEPLMQKEWPTFAKALSERGIAVDMVSNGWLFSQEIAEQAKALQLKGIAFSLDGLEESHTYLRQLPGCWQKVLDNFKICQDVGFPAVVITTLYQHNLGELRQMHRILADHGVGLWRIQLGMPAGRMAENRALMAQPEDILRLVPLISEFADMPGPLVITGHNIGYYSGCEGRILRSPSKNDIPFWFGCVAGINTALIESNGNVKGCCWMPVEGNLHERSFREIWNDPDAFSYNRKFTLENLKGHCRTCEYGVVCRGGCSRHLFDDGFPYCYHQLIKQEAAPGM